MTWERAPVTDRVGVVGLSHLGLVSSACLAAAGVPVTAVDGDARLVSSIAAGTLPVHEPGLASLLAAGRPTLTDDYALLASCTVVVIAVDTLTDERNRSDLSPLDAHVERLLPHLGPRATVALMSQVPVGYTRELATRFRTRRPDWRGELYYWVETLVIGDAVRRYQNPERIILGARSGDFEPTPALASLLRRFACPVFRMNYETAELTKAAINFYLAAAVTYANTLADLCEATGASMRAMLPALRSDARIGSFAYIRPGLGIAGGNLERDLVHLQTLADKHGIESSLLHAIVDHSAARHRWLRSALERHLLTGGRPRIALWGLAYKKNTRSTKNSAAVRLLEDVRGRATVVAYDPAVSEAPLPDVQLAPTAAAALDGAAGLVIATDWDEFATIDPHVIRDQLRVPVVIDAVGALDLGRARAAGLTCVAIGEGA